MVFVQNWLGKNWFRWETESKPLFQTFVNLGKGLWRAQQSEVWSSLIKIAVQAIYRDAATKVSVSN